MKLAIVQTRPPHQQASGREGLDTALVGARNARVTLNAGFTSVRDVGTYRGLTDVTLRNAIDRGDVPGPRMWVAGAYLTIPKGGGELNGVVPNEQLPTDMRLGVAATPDEILAAAGSRYTYSANTLALDEALEQGHKRLAMVGMSCQSSIAPTMWSRKIGKISKPIVFNIGLLCSKTFDDAIFEELFWAKYGLPKAEMTKMNIKGVFQIWMKDGSYHEINLKECHAWTREGCNHCPDFAAEHADISTGGIGKDNDWTLTIVRTDLGREIMQRMIADGSVIARPGDSDPAAIALMRKLAEKSRARWPETAEASVRVGLPIPKRKGA